VGEVLEHAKIKTERRKEGKEKVQTYPKAAWGLVQALSEQRTQVPSTILKYEKTHSYITPTWMTEVWKCDTSLT
ncbi:hypothetical protein J6590_079818, partial [Homalodisca vitripennis]